MGIEQKIISQWLKKHSSEEKLDLVREMIPRLLETMSREDRMTLASQIVP